MIAVERCYWPTPIGWKISMLHLSQDKEAQKILFGQKAR